MLTGCTAPRQPAIELEPSVRDRILDSARQEAGNATEMIAIEIGSHGPDVDAWFIRFCKTSGPSKMAKQVAQYLAKLEGREKTLALFGPCSRKTAQVAIDALRLCRGKDLTKVTFVFCGEEDDFARIRTIDLGFGGSLRFVRHPQRE